MPTNSPSFPSFYLDNILISPSNSVINLGVVFDSDQSLSIHIAIITTMLISINIKSDVSVNILKTPMCCPY